MKILSGSVEIQALGAFEEHAYQDGTSRRVLRIRMAEVPTPAQLEAICSGQVTVQDDTGHVAGAYEGFNTVHECYLALGIYEPAEKEIIAQRARALNAEQELLTMRAKATDTEQRLTAMQAELDNVKAERTALLRQSQPDALGSSPVI